MSNVEIPPELLARMEALARERAGATFEDDRFCYGHELGTAAWYASQYPGFTDEQCKILALYSSGVRAKELRAILKKQKRKHANRGGKQVGNQVETPSVQV